MVEKDRNTEGLWRILARHERHIERVKSRTVASLDMLTFAESCKSCESQSKMKVGERRIDSVLASDGRMKISCHGRNHHHHPFSPPSALFLISRTFSVSVKGMRVLRQGVVLAHSQPLAVRSFASISSNHSRTAAFRRILSDRRQAQTALSSQIHLLRPSNCSSVSSILRSPLSLPSLPARETTIRSFHTGHWLRQQPAKAEEEVKGGVNEEPIRDGNASGEAEASGSKTQEKTEPGSEEQPAGEEGAKEQKSKDEPLPPPPHGDKTPWQVFTETLRSEFKASKEWNESTKQLAAGYQDLTQNEAIKKAKSAYSQTSDVVGSTTSAALKTTGRAIGQGAAWAWDTPVVKGLRKGAEATGKGIEKVTRPIRETEAYKNVKETIDDGASSRYGGWMEKEERKRRRELREAKEAQNGGKSTEPMVEDPKYEILCSLFAQ